MHPLSKAQAATLALFISHLLDSGPDNAEEAVKAFVEESGTDPRELQAACDSLGEFGEETSPLSADDIDEWFPEEDDDAAPNAG